MAKRVIWLEDLSQLFLQNTRWDVTMADPGLLTEAGFCKPIGLQTNLMVYGPGEYCLSENVRIGVPLDFLIGIVALVLAPPAFLFRGQLIAT